MADEIVADEMAGGSAEAESVAKGFHVTGCTPAELARLLIGMGGTAARDVYSVLAAAAWEPIESAPKDGTVVILSRGDRVTVGSWAEWQITRPVRDRITGANIGLQIDDSGAAWDSWDGGFSDFAGPTRWMPLPPPQKEQGE